MYIYSHMHYDSFSIGLLLQSTWTLPLYLKSKVSAYVSMALSRVVSEIFNAEKYCDLEIRVKGHSRSFKLVLEICTIQYIAYSFVLVF